MTLATFTLALALSATHAQVPPAPPAAPPPPAVPAMPVIPPVPMIADFPDFDLPDFDFPALEIPDFEMPDVGALLASVDVDAAMIAMRIRRRTSIQKELAKSGVSASTTSRTTRSRRGSGVSKIAMSSR